MRLPVSVTGRRQTCIEREIAYHARPVKGLRQLPANADGSTTTMAKIRVIDREGTRLEVEGQAGLPLMYTLRDLEHGVEAICGGMCSCATCHVYVAADWMAKLPPASEEERELLEELDSIRENSRLSCQVPFEEALDGLEVEIAPEE